VTPPGALPGEDHKKADARRTPEILRRLASAFVLAAVALGAVIASPWSFLVLVIVAGAILTSEWGRLTRGEGRDPITIIAAADVAAVALFATLGQPELALALLAAAAVAIALISIRRSKLGWSIAGLLYVALPALALVWLRGDQDLGVKAVLFLLAVAWTTDTASYAGGRSLGGPKLAPRISPKKTWSGFVVGTLTPALIGYAFALILGGTSPWRLALVSIGLALACQIGDLLESAVKRHFGVKDMSQLIPGHGGLFDRIDSFLLASVAAGLIALRNPTAPGAGLLIW
jgi:phosphatidate cytidylyltransferase